MKLSDESIEALTLSYIISSSSGEFYLHALSEEDFLDPQLKEFFSLCCSCRAAGVSCSMQSLFEQDWTDAELLLYLGSIRPSVPPNKAIETLKNYTWLRELVANLEKLNSDSLESPEEVLEEIKLEAQKDNGLVLEPSFSAEDLEIDPFKEEPFFAHWPFESLKMKCRPSDLIIVGARPGTGKTTFMLNLAVNIGISSSIFSYEASKEMVVKKLLQLKDLAFEDRIALKHIKIHEKSYSFEQLCALIRRDHFDYGVSLFFLDYVQLITTRAQREKRLQMDYIAIGLKNLCKELGINIIALAQTKRETDERPPILSDLKESGSFEAAADAVLFLYTKGEAAESLDLDCYIRKDRYGPPRKATLTFNKEKGVISDEGKADYQAGSFWSKNINVERL